MSLSLFWVMAGGALGALTRFGIGEWVRLRTRWPGWLAILVANLVGTALLALAHFTALGIGVGSPEAHAFAAVGYCGALTTYSAFGLDTVLLWYEGQRAVAVGRLCVTLACGALLIRLVAAGLGAAP